MGKYKLVYFDGRGRAEVARMLFKLAGEEFEDQRIKEDAWPEYKKSTLWEQLPFLEVDGEAIYQSRSIERFLARKFGLAGKSELDQFKVDMIQETMEDGMKPLFAIFSEKDEEKKPVLKKKAEDEEFPKFFNALEKLLKSNKGGDGYFVGDKLTLADLSVVQMSTFPLMVGIDIKIDNFPKLKALKERVESQPKIAEWIANRPKTEF